MKHEIEIEGLPEGWRAVAYRVAIKDVDYILTQYGVKKCLLHSFDPVLIIEKIKPRRIVLEETTELRRAKPSEYYENSNGIISNNSLHETTGEYKIWRVVDEE